MGLQRVRQDLAIEQQQLFPLLFLPLWSVRPSLCSSLVNFKLAACCLLETLLSSPTPSHRKPSFRDPCRPLALDLPVQPHPVTRSSLSLLTRSLWFPLSLYEPSSLTPPGELMHRALTLSPTPILSLIDPDHFLPDKTLFNRQPLLSS